MSREFFVMFDEATGAEISRGSGPAGAAALQQKPGVAVRTVAAANFRSARALALDPATALVVAAAKPVR